MLTEERMEKIKAAIENEMPDHLGFALLIIPYGKPGAKAAVRLITNCDAPKLAAPFREIAGRLERGSG